MAGGSLFSLPQGNTQALEILFSAGNATAMIFMDKLLAMAFVKPERLCNQLEIRQMKGYAMGLGCRLGLFNDSRQKLLQIFTRWLDKNSLPPEKSLASIIPGLQRACRNSKDCRVVHDSLHGQSLLIHDELYAREMVIGDFASRLERSIGEYNRKKEVAGQRDWKMLATVYRILLMAEELLEKGGICFPLKDRKEIIPVIQGQTDFGRFAHEVRKLLGRVEFLKRNEIGANVYDRDFAEETVLGCYGLCKWILKKTG